MIRFTCPTCKSALQSKGEKAGEKVSCPKCGQRLLIPNPVKPAADNKTVLGSLLPSFAKPREAHHSVASAMPSSNDGAVNVTCPCCGRIIPLPPHEVSTVIQCACCLTPFNPSSFVALQKGVPPAPQQLPSPHPATEGESQSPLLICKGEGIRSSGIGLRMGFYRYLPITVAGFFFIGILGLLSWLFWRSKTAEAPNPEMLRYLPNYSQIIISIRPTSIAHSEIFRDFAHRFPKYRMLEAESEEALGVSMIQIKQIMIAGVNNDVGVFICRLNSPASIADILANRKDSKVHEEKTGKYTIYDNDNKLGPSFCIVQKDMILFGQPQAVREILLREGPPELSSGLQTAMRMADFSKEIVIAVNTKDCYRKMWTNLKVDQREPHEIEDAMMRADASMSADVTIGKAIEGRLVILCKDKDAARELMRIQEKAMAKVKDDPHTPRSVIKGLSSLRSSQEGAKVIVTATIDLDTLAKVFEWDAR